MHARVWLGRPPCHHPVCPAPVPRVAQGEDMRVVSGSLLLCMQPVLSEHHNAEMPGIAMFAMKDIPPLTELT